LSLVIMPLVVIAYDLSTTDAVSDPEDLYQECWVSLLQE
jgi:hypothetical protein